MLLKIVKNGHMFSRNQLKWLSASSATIRMEIYSRPLPIDQTIENSFHHPAAIRSLRLFLTTPEREQDTLTSVCDVANSLLKFCKRCDNSQRNLNTAYTFLPKNMQEKRDDCKSILAKANLIIRSDAELEAFSSAMSILLPNSKSCWLQFDKYIMTRIHEIDMISCLLPAYALLNAKNTMLWSDIYYDSIEAIAYRLALESHELDTAISNKEVAVEFAAIALQITKELTQYPKRFRYCDLERRPVVVKESISVGKIFNSVALILRKPAERSN